jgi:hypothetical protein
VTIVIKKLVLILFVGLLLVGAIPDPAFVSFRGDRPSASEEFFAPCGSVFRYTFEKQDLALNSMVMLSIREAGTGDTIAWAWEGDFDLIVGYLRYPDRGENVYLTALTYNASFIVGGYEGPCLFSELEGA